MMSLDQADVTMMSLGVDVTYLREMIEVIFSARF